MTFEGFLSIQKEKELFENLVSEKDTKWAVPEMEGVQWLIKWINILQ